MSINALALEFGAGFSGMALFAVRAASQLGASQSGPPSDDLGEEQRDAVVEAISVLGLQKRRPRRHDLIVHNGLAASRRRT